MIIGDTGRFTDPRDGQVYPWKIMKDGKKWMTKNLNFQSPHARCYDDKDANGDIYGRLYDFKVAKQVIPDGWRLPDLYRDFEPLFSAYRMDGTGGGKELLKEGTAGFEVVLSGMFSHESNQFCELGEEARFWTSTAGEQNNEPWPFGVSIQTMYRRGTGEDAYYISYALSWREGYSIRCVMDV